MSVHYRHHLNSESSPLPVGKVVCVGRNYAEHARELNNPVPAEPILFIKPATALAPMEQPVVLPKEGGECHFETELAVLIGEPLSCCSEQQAVRAIAGIGLGLDLTLRELQSQLKAKGHPWEKAKAFDCSCPMSGFVSPSGDLQSLAIRLYRNGQLQQDGSTADMLMPVAPLIAYASHHFTLLPGDIVLTGTPAGVGPLQAGDQLDLELGDMVRVTTHCTI